MTEALEENDHSICKFTNMTEGGHQAESDMCPRIQSKSGSKPMDIDTTVKVD